MPAMKRLGLSRPLRLRRHPVARWPGVEDPYTGARTQTTEETPATTSDTGHAGGLDGDPTTVERLGTTSDSAIAVSAARFRDGQGRHAVLARNDRFPDSLAGSPLSADGPLLFTPTAQLTKDVRDELVRVLPSGSTVYLLGGDVALSRDVDSAVRDAGLRPVRLEGADRAATALTIADEVRRPYGDTGEVAVARGWGPASDPNGTAGWVDSVTGGAWATRRGVPVVISATDALSSEVGDWLAGDAPTRTILLGHHTALCDAVLRAVPNGARIGGGDRSDTAAAVATDLWGTTRRSPDRRFVLIDGWSPTSWRHGLAAAGLAADAHAPMLLIRGDAMNQPPSTLDLVTSCSSPSVDLLLMGPIGAHVADAVEAMDGRSC